MPGDSKIEWTEATWNPVTGCSKVSPGCAYCYAETLTERYAGRPGWIEEHRPWTPANAGHNVRLRPERLDQPLRWTKPRMIFVNSMSDLFHEEVPDEYIARVFTTMANSPRHTFQVLTKRPERMARFVRRLTWTPENWAAARVVGPDGAVDQEWRADLLPDDHWSQEDEPATPLPNVWLGTSIENRRFADRADYLRDTPAAVRFISAEPLLGPLVGVAGQHGAVHRRCVRCGRTYLQQHVHHEPREGGWVCGNCMGDEEGYPVAMFDRQTPGLDLTGIDWLIVGGESGPGARPMDLQWVRDLRDACGLGRRWQIDGPAFFVKQLGGARPGTKLEDLPEDLRIREFPR